ncbi:hypothetical protein DFH28DRAFT_996045 [Melampsora americana]|nr:hypothetical protein DFH28DRAFT_996045 [Melampsora americana]
MIPFLYDQPRAVMISALERAASAMLFTQSTSQPDPTQTQSRNPPSNTTQTQHSQIGLNTDVSTANQATNRTQINQFLNNGIINYNTSAFTSAQPTNTPISKESMLNMTSEELRCLAEKNASRGINKDQMEKLIAFHESQQHALAMMALEIGVSVSAIEATWGKRIAVRMATAWNRFLQSDEAKTLFKMYGGVANGAAMSELSQLWKHMSPEAKASFKLPLPDVDLDFGDKVVSNKRVRSIVHPRTILKATPTSLEKSEKQVQLFLTNIIGQATPIAKSCNCEFVFFAVSKHVAAHNFQHRVATPGAHLAVEMITETAGTDEFASQVQSYITGNSTEALEAKRHCKGGNAKSMKKEVFARLGRLLSEHTNTALSNWPWSSCDSSLATFGLRVALTRPDSKLNIDVLKTPSAQLSGPNSRLIIFELDQGGIGLLPINSTGDQ